MFVNEFEQIRNEEEYNAALAHVEKHMDVVFTEAESVAFRNLVDLVERYEDETDPIEEPLLADVIEYCMDQRGLSLSDIAPIFGGIKEAEAVLAGTLRITKVMADELSDQYAVIVPSNYRFRSVPDSPESTVGDQSAVA